MLTDGRGAVKVLGLVAVDDRPGVVGPGPAAGMPDGRTLNKERLKMSTDLMAAYFDVANKVMFIN